MTLYNPFSATVEKIRLLFKSRMRDGQLAYLGDSNSPGARVEIPDKKGYMYARFPEGSGFGTPFPVRSAGAAFQVYPGCPVYVAGGYNDEMEIVSAHYQELDRNNIDTRTLNPLHQQSKWVYLWQLTIALCSAVSTSVTGSYLVTVKKFRHFTGNVYGVFETGEAADKIDLSSYNPALDMHRYAGVWVDTYGNVAEVVASTAQSLFTPLDETDVQECVDNPPGRPPDAVALKLFYLANDQGAIRQQPAKDRDVRQFLNMPQVWGFPTDLTTRERVRPGYTLVTGPYTASGNGDLTVESGGRVIIKAVDNLTATTDPTVNDDADDGYTVDSVWVNTTTPAWFVLVDPTPGAALWLPLATGGGFAPDDAKYLLQQANGSLPNAQAMGALATGIVKNTTTTGVQSIATAGTDYTSPAGTENLSNKTITASSLVATALSLLIGGFKAIFTHAITADRTYTFPDITGTVLTHNSTATITGKTIDGDDNTLQDVPLTAIKTVGANTKRFVTRDASGVITDATNPPLDNLQHTHADAAGGGQITDAALSAAVSASKGGTGSTSLTAHALLVGNGTGAVATLAPSTARNVPVSDGTDFISRALTLADISDTRLKQSVRLSTIAALAACTYNNGSSGVGATLTENANGALTIDGVAVAVNDRVLIKNQASGFQNGIYTVTATGSAGAVFVLTRDVDSDTSAEILNTVVFVQFGNTNADTWYTCTNASAITMGTTAITWAGGRPIYLPTPGQNTLNLGTDITSNSTSFLDIDGSNLSLNVTSISGNYLVGFNGVVTNTGSAYIYFDVTLNGSRYAGDDGMCQVLSGTNANNVFFGRVINTSAGANAFKPQWKMQSGTGKLYVGAGTSGLDTHPQFWVIPLD